TTNRVHLSDYEIVLQEPAAMLLWAHHSNFQIVGFTSEPELSELTALAKRNQMWMIDDLGSGALLDTARYGLAHEPTVQEALAAGADLVCFSGDKLLGGPQAGIIVGRADLIRRISRHPLARAVRADKLCLAALTATLTHYLKDEVETKIPVWRMMAETPEQIQTRAGRWASTLQIGEVTTGRSTIGGGSLPGETLPTYLLALKVKRPNNFLERLRQNNPAIIARIEEEQVVFDPRTVSERDESTLLVGIQRALQ
ncbi:MAG: L-seryl-tRNA(Sec) selenium transferase, partial [Chloroflexi bacterium]|nr:L-seryl-tRNA(Sec) selenium transferase [Chloroflexota bacterium]